jgi:hypothetical protein
LNEDDEGRRPGTVVPDQQPSEEDEAAVSSSSLLVTQEPAAAAAGAVDASSRNEPPAESASTRATGKGRGSKSTCSVQIRDPPVSDTTGYVVVRTEEKHGPLQRAIPVMPLALAVVSCVFNIVLPGTGTLLAAFSVFCCGTTTRMNSALRAFLLNIVSGLLQLSTFLLIVGWIWSITWGMTFVQLALSAKENRERSPVPYYVRRHSSVE